MFLEPTGLASDLDRLERIEKATLRAVTQAILASVDQAIEVFSRESDKPQDIAEDLTREAMDTMGLPRTGQRLFGKTDYKRACYVFGADGAVRQALFVDSKAEKDDRTATIQTSQTSMRIRHIRAGASVDEQGKIDPVIQAGGLPYLTTTVFVGYYYVVENGRNRLISITVSCIPNGMLQGRYNPSATDTIWIAGRNAPSRGEDFRVRLSYTRLRAKARWRVQTVDPHTGSFDWAD